MTTAFSLAECKEPGTRTEVKKMLARKIVPGLNIAPDFTTVKGRNGALGQSEVCPHFGWISEQFDETLKECMLYI